MNADLSAEERDARLAQLLETLSQAHRQGQSPNFEALAAQYPDLADELRSLWATAQFAAAFATPATTSLPATKTDTNSLPMPKTFGDYDLLEEIGRGGMGVVYKARQCSLDRIVALKMVRDLASASGKEWARLRAEAKSVSWIQHPNIVQVYDFGEYQGQPFFTMQYIDGETLAQRVARGPLPNREAAMLLARIARAVHAAHTQGVLHRDLKPSNVLIDRVTERPYVTDFGLAKRFSSEETSNGSVVRTQTGVIVGTPSYMAPEQASGRRDLDPTADVYSLGAMLYEMLTGRPPFQASHPVDTLLLVLEQEPVPPRDLNPKVDRELEMICLKCLQKPTELRYPTAEALAEDLEAYCKGEALSTQPSGLRYFLARMLRETHHATVLENWGLLWMWHSLQLFLLCLLTQMMAWHGLTDHMAYLLLWSIGLITWGTIFWQLRRQAGPVLFVERQIAHAWAAGVCAAIAMFVIEVAIPLPVLTLSPAIAVAAGMVFVFKAGILSGRFYLSAILLFATAVLMPLIPHYSVVFFGTVAALSFFLPGLKYYRQRLARIR